MLGYAGLREGQLLPGISAIILWLAGIFNRSIYLKPEDIAPAQTFAGLCNQMGVSSGGQGDRASPGSVTQ